ncbi:MAG TPA: hypothetical protein ENH03_03210 [Candidatus Bathyarchaeota archaeon]|nr:hypothetical protein [Candidatus Bathyarchaeota archaeon]
MRSYIFTDLERKTLRDWLEGRITLKNVRLRKTLSRVRLFKRLSEDVNLYSVVRSRLAESKST